MRVHSILLAMKASIAHLEVLVEDKKASLSIAVWVTHCADLHPKKAVALTFLMEDQGMTCFLLGMQTPLFIYI